MNNLISVIVPIYNVQAYLPKCLDSLVGQSYQNLEIICIDDGSTDNCANILAEYSKQDSRIKVFSKENAGVSVARNFGLSEASGEYIFFIDSDDYISEDYLEGLFEAINGSEAELSYNDNLINVYEHKNIKSSRKCSKNKGVYKLSDRLWNKVRTSSCNKLYKKSFLTNNSLTFEQGLRFEDRLFFNKLRLFVNKIAISRKGNYFYRRIGESFCNSYYDKDKNGSKFDEIEVYRRMYEFYDANHSLDRLDSFYWLLKHFSRTKEGNHRHFFEELKSLFSDFSKEFVSRRTRREKNFYYYIMNKSFEENLIYVNKQSLMRKMIRFLLNIKRGV